MMNQPEANEQKVQSLTEVLSSIGTVEEYRQLDALMTSGFSWEESTKLVDLRTHLYENAEMCQRMANDHRIQFVRWLYERGEVSDN